MKTKVDFKALALADLEFGAEQPNKETQEAFSSFLANRKKVKTNTRTNVLVSAH